MQLPLRPRLAYSAAVFSGLLYWFAFPGRHAFGAWHGLVALVAFIPMWVALQGQTPKRALVIGLLTGTTMNVAGFTWLVDMLQTFSGFPPVICFFFAVLVCGYQGGRLALMGWLHGRSAARGWPAATVFVAAFIASELAYPLLFPWYFAATTYQLPALSQTAELGGPILVGAILVGVNVALAEPLLARIEKRRPIWSRVAVPMAVLAAALIFAAIRIPTVDATAQAAEPVHVGVVQGNLGLIEKREDPAEGLRRHMRLTNALKAKGVELVVWSESSVTMLFPERGYQMMMRGEFAGSLGVPDDLRRRARERRRARASVLQHSALGRCARADDGSLRQGVPARVRGVPTVRRNDPEALRVVAQQRALHAGDARRPARHHRRRGHAPGVGPHLLRGHPPVVPRNHVVSVAKLRACSSTCRTTPGSATQQNRGSTSPSRSSAPSSTRRYLRPRHEQRRLGHCRPRRTCHGPRRYLR